MYVKKVSRELFIVAFCLLQIPVEPAGSVALYRREEPEGLRPWKIRFHAAFLIPPGTPPALAYLPYLIEY